MNDRTDQELLLAWRAGDRDAGSELIARHTGSLRNFLAYKVPPSDLAELTSATFENCVRNIDRFRGDSAFRTYLFGIARFTVLNHYRAIRRSPQVDDDVGLHSIVEMGAGPSTALAAREEQRLLIEGLRRLPLNDQILFELYYLEELSAAELAEMYPSER